MHIRSDTGLACPPRRRTSVDTMLADAARSEPSSRSYLVRSDCKGDYAGNGVALAFVADVDLAVD